MTDKTETPKPSARLYRGPNESVEAFAAEYNPARATEDAQDNPRCTPGDDIMSATTQSHPNTVRENPEGNPKHAEGRKKTPLRFIPPVALAAEGRVMELGGNKYGIMNWSDGGVVASVYYDAALRHLLQWYAGEDIDPESGQPHTAHVRACMGILIDADAQGVLEDDRPKTAPFPTTLDPVNSDKGLEKADERLATHYTNGQPIFAPDSAMLDATGNCSVFDDIDC